MFDKFQDISTTARFHVIMKLLQHFLKINNFGQVFLYFFNVRKMKRELTLIIP